ncbi:homocysteine methyltransferase [Bifidobacterium saguini DSM 23967]|uniref:S-methylmethionine:homocysteine methyltransferase n=2 Tax=Bifidobacterium saguini TaxID=762210 RepID=A0A087DA35_9BIFI|nr:homocysteine S-methyltransferase [Bifidobacterium saguini]KFI92385.1 homocysteine methyltransferase [Bifidobacterium saguini DSM 23967]QTB91083.1 homocysteine S-methyltransferase [Bifidobacterium saguini]
MLGVIGRALAAQSPLIIDGAMATELEQRGVDTTNELWAAIALIQAPQSVRDVHETYFEAGANIAITDTYQANIPAFEKCGISHEEAEHLIGTAVSVALEARERYRQHHANADDALAYSFPNYARPLLVAGSVGPYGAFLADGSEYTGDYHLSDTDYRDFHRSRMQILADSGVDLFAFETMPNISEVQALIGLLTDEFPDREAWVSFSLSDSGHLCDGTSLETAVSIADACPHICAIGVNCVQPELVTNAIGHISAVTAKPIIVYPNNGDVYHPDTKTWTRCSDALSLSDLAPRWVEAGASLIGGCCRTSPADIYDLAKALHR